MRMVIAVLCGCLSLSLAAAVYKWVDEHGVVHYGDKPADRRAREITIEPVQSVAPVPVDPVLEQQRREYRQKLEALERERRELEARQARDRQQRREAERRAHCDKLARRLEDYEDERRYGCTVRECERIDEQIRYYEAELDRQC